MQSQWLPWIVAFALSIVSSVAQPSKPNIVIILADDLGYGDVSCYNPKRGKISTPNIDRLAAQGMRFTDAHSSSGVCSPSRYALLTGRYHWRTRLQQGIVNLWGAPLIAPDRLTIAGLAHQNGYHTACIGKWHLGWDWPISAADKQYFTGFGGKAGGGGVNVITNATAEHREAWSRVFSQPIPGGPTTRGFDVYFGTDVPNWPPYCFIEKDRTVGIPSTLLPAADLVRNRASLQGPALPGWVFEEVLPALVKGACAFVSDSARAKKPFLLYLPLTTPHTPIAPSPAWKGKSPLGPYGDLVMETDAAVGSVLKTLEETGAATNTIVIFTSDNGPAAYVGAKELEAKGHFPSGDLRGYKADAWEGGHRVAFVVRWPGIVQAGKVCSQLTHQADVLRTLADILSVKLPDNAAEDSFSLLPLLKGGDAPTRRNAVSCSSTGIPAFRLGNWKYIASNEPELYDLAADLRETNNLAKQQPERLAQMQSEFEMLISNGRSTPGSPQANDVRVRRSPIQR